MDILVSSFERLLWFLAFQVYSEGSVAQKRKTAGEKVKGWLEELKSKGGFGVEYRLLEAAKVDFESERVSDDETIAVIKEQYSVKNCHCQLGCFNGHRKRRETLQIHP